MGHITEGDRAVPHLFDDGAGNVIEVGGHGKVANHDLGRTPFNEAAGRGGRCVCNGGFEFGEGDIVGLKAIGVGLDFDLAHAATHVENFGDAGNGLQPTLDGPVGERANFGGR